MVVARLAQMAIALHTEAAHPSGFLLVDRRSADRCVAPIRNAGARVDVMTTMAANLGSALSLQRTPVLSESTQACSCAFALTGHGQAYNEQAFHHFLSVERKRSEASTRPLLLLLVEFEKQLGKPVAVSDEIAARLFAALGRSLRDTDVIGWYREGRVAGAVLTDLGDTLQPVLAIVTSRVRGFLQRDLPPGLASLVQVRVYQLGARADSVIGTVA